MTESDSHSIETPYETDYDYFYELEIPGFNVNVTEFTPKSSPNHLCVHVRNSNTNAVSCFSKL